MPETAFEILGLEPTADGRAIRAAFVRLARIYHPDRFVDVPDDVRAEAERRMKEVSVAYEQLRELRRASRTAAPVISQAELDERARKVRDALEAKRIEDEQNRARWRRWEEIERQTREKAEIDARIAAMVRDGAAGPTVGEPETPSEPPAPTKRRSRFDERIESARRGETAPLVKRAENG